MKAKPIPYSREELHKLFRYYGETGELHWRESPRRGVKVGAVAGHINSNGYHHIGINGAGYRAHRLIFKMLCNQEPEQIDHLDGVRVNNRIGNLRASTKSGNQRNTKMYSNNTSGEPGIGRHHGKWEVTVCNKQYGTYTTMAEAIVARDKARQELGGYTNRDIREEAC